MSPMDATTISGDDSLFLSLNLLSFYVTDNEQAIILSYNEQGQ